MNSSPTKVLCIGIDAANPGLLRTWAAEGQLPTLGSLIEKGITGDIQGLQGLFVGSTWPSLYSGVSPAEHGLHYLVQLRPGTYEFYRPADEGLSRCEPFWTHLSRAGRRVAVLDVPLTRLDPSLNGIQVVEWGGHDFVFGFQASAPDLEKGILSRFGPHPQGPSCDGLRSTTDEYETFLGNLIEGVRTKSKLTRHFLGRGDWDLFMQVFTESHCVGHQCWHLHDPAHPAHDPSIRSETGNPLLRVYQAIDGAIGEILEEAGDAFVFVFSAHGMDYRYGAQFLLKEMLLRLGVTTAVHAGPGAQEQISLPLALLRWAWRRMPDGVHRRLAPLRDQVRGGGTGSALPFLGVDFSSSPCFPVPNGLAVGGIRLNLVGREPEGMLDPADADAFSAELAADLLAIRDRRTGRPLIKAVYRTSEIYHGAHLDHLPDLLVEWDDSVPTGSTNLGDGTGAVVHAFSEKTGHLDGANDYGRSGEHRETGIFVAAGNGLRPRRLETGVSILDLAPTLTKLLGVDLPACEGTPIPELLE